MQTKSARGGARPDRALQQTIGLRAKKDGLAEEKLALTLTLSPGEGESWSVGCEEVAHLEKIGLRLRLVRICAPNTPRHTPKEREQTTTLRRGLAPVFSMGGAQNPLSRGPGGEGWGEGELFLGASVLSQKKRPDSESGPQSKTLGDGPCTQEMYFRTSGFSLVFGFRISDFGFRFWKHRCHPTSTSVDLSLRTTSMPTRHTSSSNSRAPAKLRTS